MASRIIRKRKRIDPRGRSKLELQAPQPLMSRLPALVPAQLLRVFTLLGSSFYTAVLLLIQEPSLAQFANHGGGDAQYYLSRSVERRNAADYQGAMADLNRSIQIAPNGLYGRHYINRGDLRYQLGDFYGAVTDYNQGISLGNNFGVSYKRRGVAKSATGDQHGAIVDYNIAIEILSPPKQTSPDLVIEVHVLRGNAYGALGATQEACNDYKKAVSYGDQPTSQWLQSPKGDWCRNKL